jgi:hypothetical protein
MNKEPLLGERLCTVDLLVIISLDYLPFILGISCIFVTKQATLMRRSIVLSLPVQLVFPGLGTAEKRFKFKK